MRTNPKAQLRIFHHTIKDRVTNQLRSIEKIATFVNVNYQLQALESAASLLKDTCAREWVKLIEHSRDYPSKFMEESLSLAEFECMIATLRQNITRCANKITLSLVKTGSFGQSSCHADKITLHLKAINDMFNTITLKKTTTQFRFIPSSKNMKNPTENATQDAVIYIGDENPVLGTLVP